MLIRRLWWALFFCSLISCTGVPPGVKPVTDFRLEDYLGTWYEVARLDHSFERGLQQVTATYSLRGDGGVRVVNRGFESEKGLWREAEGKAYFIGDPTIGRLKVSFFGPFYGAYNIVRLADDYSVALVVGPDVSYGWILARTPTIAPELLSSYQATAEQLGIALSDWIIVQQ